MKISFIGLTAVFVLLVLAAPATVLGSHSAISIFPNTGNLGADVDPVKVKVTTGGLDLDSGKPCAEVAGTRIGGTGITFSNCVVTFPDEFRFDLGIPPAVTAAGSANFTIAVPLVAGGVAHNVSVGFLVAGGAGPGPGPVVGAVPPKVIPTNVTNALQFLDLLERIVNWIFVVVLVGAVVYIVLAGWQFISGGGEPQAVSQARSKLLYAAIGIGVAVLSKGIVAAIRNIIGS